MTKRTKIEIEQHDIGLRRVIANEVETQLWEESLDENQAAARPTMEFSASEPDVDQRESVQGVGSSIAPPFNRPVGQFGEEYVQPSDTYEGKADEQRNIQSLRAIDERDAEIADLQQQLDEQADQNGKLVSEVGRLMKEIDAMRSVLRASKANDQAALDNLKAENTLIRENVDLLARQAEQYQLCFEQAEMENNKLKAKVDDMTNLLMRALAKLL